MFIRYNEALDFWEYDSSAGQTGAGPWIKLPVDAAQLNNLPPAVTIPPNIAFTNVDNNFTAIQTLNSSGMVIKFPDIAEIGLVNTNSNSHFRLLNYLDQFMLYYVNNPLFRATTDGNFHISTYYTGLGFIFPSTPTASGNANLLDDYEEGSWTPIFYSDSGGQGTAYSTQFGRYTKIGNKVHADFHLGITSADWASGSVYLGGLPFASAAGGNFDTAVIDYFVSLNGSTMSIHGLLAPGNGAFSLYHKSTPGPSGQDSNLLVSNFINGTRFLGSIDYRTET